MSSYNPPYPYFNGITYNKSYFDSSGTGLSRAQANALYLQKTMPDTATALETFNAGIKTNTIEALTSSGTLSLGISTNTLTVKAPITIGYSGVPTSTTQLGGKVTPSFTTTTLAAGTPTNIATVVCGVGIYLITANVYFNFPGGYSVLSINTTTATDTNCYVTSNYGTGSCVQITRIVNSSIDGTQTWILVAQVASATTSGSVIMDT